MSHLLPSWNDGKTKEAILNYVQAVTDPNQATFVPVEDRIATFDNDGTCWNEKPAYIQLVFSVFSLARLKQMATDDPKLREKPHFRAAYEGDMGYFASLDPHAGGDVKQLMQVVFDSHAGMPQDGFEAMVREFMTTAKHPRFGVPFIQMIYQPMVELIQFLHDQEFKVFLCSAGGMTFMRAASEEIYGIPKERVIGSNISFETKMTDDGPVVMRKPGIIDPIDDGPGKPINIELHIGRKPIIAGGNSDGDLHMLWLAQTGANPSLSLLVNHDDAEREYEYDIGSEKTLQMAPERGWTVVSMKNDWNRVFAWE
jgi:phosphoserine phosphatase